MEVSFVRQVSPESVSDACSEPSFLLFSRLALLSLSLSLSLSLASHAVTTRNLPPIEIQNNKKKLPLFQVEDAGGICRLFLAPGVVHPGNGGIRPVAGARWAPAEAVVAGELGGRRARAAATRLAGWLDSHPIPADPEPEPVVKEKEAKQEAKEKEEAKDEEEGKEEERARALSVPSSSTAGKSAANDNDDKNDASTSSSSSLVQRSAGSEGALPGVASAPVVARGGVAGVPAAARARD